MWPRIRTAPDASDVLIANRRSLRKSRLSTATSDALSFPRSSVSYHLYPTALLPSSLPNHNHLMLSDCPLIRSDQPIQLLLLFLHPLPFPPVEHCSVCVSSSRTLFFTLSPIAISRALFYLLFELLSIPSSSAHIVARRLHLHSHSRLRCSSRQILAGCRCLSHPLPAIRFSLTVPTRDLSVRFPITFTHPLLHYLFTHSLSYSEMARTMDPTSKATFPGTNDFNSTPWMNGTDTWFNVYTWINSQVSSSEGLL